MKQREPQQVVCCVGVRYHSPQPTGYGLEAMRAWMEKEKRLLVLDAAIARGLADSESGRGRDIDTVRQDFVKRYAQFSRLSHVNVSFITFKVVKAPL